MSQENLYIIIKLSNLVMTFFRYFLFFGFGAIVFLKVFGEEFDQVSIKKQILEILYMSIFSGMFLMVSDTSIHNPVIKWTFLLGIMIGVLQSLQIKLFVNNNQIFAYGRHFNVVLFGLSCLFLEYCFLFQKSFLNFAMVPLTLSLGVILSLNLMLIIKIKHT